MLREDEVPSAAEVKAPAQPIGSHYHEYRRASPSVGLAYPMQRSGCSEFDAEGIDLGAHERFDSDMSGPFLATDRDRIPQSRPCRDTRARPCLGPPSRRSPPSLLVRMTR